MVLMVLQSERGKMVTVNFNDSPFGFLATALIDMGDEDFVNLVVDHFDLLSNNLSGETEERVVSILFDRLHEIWPEEIEA